MIQTAVVCCSFPALVRMRGRTAYVSVASLLSTLASSFDLSLKVGLDLSCAAVKPAAYCDTAQKAAAEHGGFACAESWAAEQCDIASRKNISALPVQIAMIEALTTIVQDRLLPPPDINDLIMPTVLANLGITGMADEVGSSSTQTLQNDTLLQGLCNHLLVRTH